MIRFWTLLFLLLCIAGCKRHEDLDSSKRYKCIRFCGKTQMVGYSCLEDERNIIVQKVSDNEYVVSGPTINTMSFSYNGESNEDIRIFYYQPDKNRPYKHKLSIYKKNGKVVIDFDDNAVDCFLEKN